MGWSRAFLLFGLMASVALGEMRERIDPTGKTADYYRILLKRPRPGYLFERFCNSWLEEHDLADLETFLSGSEDPSAKLLLAFYYERVREPAKAAALYDGLIDEQPEQPELLYYKAAVDAERGLHAVAAEGLRGLLDLPGADAELRLKALKLLGRSLLREGKRSEGLAAWQRLLDVSGMDGDVAEELLDLQMAEGLYAEALANCDRMLGETKDAYRKVMLRMRRTSILVRMDRRSEAVDGLCEAFGLTGQGSWLQRDVLGRIEHLYRGADDMTGLCACHEKMLEEWPDNPALLQAYADALLACGKDKEALDCARELVRLVPDRQEVKEWYVDLLLGLHRSGEAVKMLEGFLERYPDDNALRMRLADVQRRAGNDKLAVEWVLAFLEHSGKTERDYLEAARSLARYGLNDEASSVFLEMLAQWPDSAAGREAVALHMSRKSYLHLQLAWKHYEWLAKDCDIDTLLRLSSALMAADSPKRALALLEGRQADFGGEYRYLSALFDASGTLGNKEELLEVGFKRVDVSSTIEEMEMATAALVYELKKQKVVEEWIGKLSAEPEPSSTHLWLLASLHLAEKQPKEADELLRVALEKDPADAELLQCRLMLAKRERDWERAEAVLIQLIDKNPSRQAAWIRELVPVLMQLGKTGESLEWIEVWKKASPNAIRPYELERDALVAANRMDDAVQAMRRATRRFDESKELKLALGRLYENCGRVPDAEQLYWRLLNAEETLDGRLSHLANIIRLKQSRNQLAELIRELERRCENAQAAAFPLLGLAECYRISHRMNERNAVLDQVLELRPNDLAVLRAKAALEEDLGNYDAARNLMLRIADEDATGSAFRKVVEFEFLYGDSATAAGLLADPRISGDDDAFLELAGGLIALGCADVLVEPLAQRAAKGRGDYRFDFLRAALLKDRGDMVAAARVFTALLGIGEERPGAAAKPKPSAAAGYPAAYAASLHPSSVNPHQARMLAQWQLEFGTWIPDELLKMYNLSMYSNNYVYRMSMHYGNPVPSQIDIPASLEELKEAVLVQLGEIAGQLPDEERGEMVAAVDEHAPYVRMLWIDPQLGRGSVAWWDALEGCYPDSEEVRLLRLLMAGQAIETEDELRVAITEVSDDHPELALRILSAGFYRFPRLLELLPGLAEKVSVDKENLRMLAQAAVFAVTRMSSTNESYQGAVDLFGQVERLCAETEEVPDEIRISLAVARAGMDKDYSKIIELLEEQFRKPDAHYAQAASVYGPSPAINYYHAMLQFNFPPHQLPDSNVAAIHAVNSFGLDKEKLKDAFIDKESGSLFRWLVLKQLGAEEEILEAAAEAIAAKERKTRDELFALACWHANRDTAQALEYLLALREDGRDDAVMQSTFDRAFLTLAGQVEELPSGLHAELKTVAEELRTSIWSDRSMRILLVDLMERLEMPLDGVVPPLAASPSLAGLFSSSSRHGYSRPPDIHQQIRTQLEQGETETALLRVAIMLRSEALRNIHRRGRQYRNNYQLVNCLQEVQRRKLEDRLLELFVPPEDGERSARKVFEYGYACERMGRREAAIEAFREVCEARPDWVGAKVRLCVGLAEEDFETAREMIAALPPGRVPGILAGFQQRMNDGSTSFESRLAMVELSMELAASAEKMDGYAGRQYVQSLENALMNQWYENNRNDRQRSRLPGLHDLTEAGSLAPGWQPPRDKLAGSAAYWKDAALVEIQRRRRECYVKLLKNTCAESAQYGMDGFSKLTGYLDFTEAETDRDELFGLARQAISNAIQYNRYGWGNQNGHRQDALEFYFMELQRRGEWSDAEKLLAGMQGGRYFRTSVKTLAELHAAETDAEYMKRFEKALEGGLNNVSGGSWVEVAFRLHRAEGRSGNLEELVWRTLEEKNSKNRWRESAMLVNAWVQSSLKSGESVDASKAYARLFEGVFTEEEMETIAAARSGSIGHVNHQAIYGKYQQLAGSFNSIDFPPEMLSAALELIAPVEKKMQQQYMVRNIVNRHLNNALNVEWIKRAALLEDWDDFGFYALYGGQQSLFCQMVNRLRGDRGKLLLKAIDEMETQTFGSRLLKAAVENNSWDKRAMQVLVHLSDYDEELAAHPERRAGLFEWLRSMEDNSGKLLDAADFPEGADLGMLDAYVAWKRERALEWFEQIESTKLSGIMQDPYNHQRRIGGAVMALLETDPEKARALFDRGCRTVKLAYAVQGNAYTDRNLLDQMLNRRKYTEAEIRFAVQVVTDIDSKEAFQWFSQNYGYQLFSRAEQRHRKEGKDSRPARLLAGQECIGILLPFGDKIELNSLRDCVGRVDRKDYAVLAEWLAGQMFPDSDIKRLLGVFLQPTEESEHWLAEFFANGEKEAVLRLQAYSWLLNRGDDKPKLLGQPDFLFGMVDLLDEAGTTIRLPQQAFHDLIGHIGDMKPEKEKQEWIDRIIGLWRSQRVDGSPSNMDTLFRLVELTAEAGRENDAQGFLAAGNLSRYPQTYAVALRNGLDGFVASRLPNAVLELGNSYSSKAWIPPEAVGRCAAIAEGIEDKQLRLVVQTVFARFYVKTESGTAQDPDRIEALLAEADESLDRPEPMQWMVSQFNQGNHAKKLEKLKGRYVRQVDPAALFLRNNSYENNAYAEYVKRLSADREIEELRKPIGILWEKMDANVARNRGNNWFFNALFQADLSDGAEDGEEWIKGFFEDAGWPPSFQLDACAWLVDRGNSKPGFLDRPEFIVAMIDRLIADSRTRLPRQVYLAALRQVVDMKSGTEKDRQAEKVLKLWNDHQVEASRTDRKFLYLLAELSAGVGKPDAASGFLKEADLKRYPKSYAIALRNGLDGYVTENLPQNLPELQNAYSPSEAWVFPETTKRYAAVAANVEDEQMRLAVRLFLARLPVRQEDGKPVAGQDALKQALADANHALDRPELMQWALNLFSDNESKKQLKQLKSRYVRQVTVTDMLRTGRDEECAAYADFAAELAESGEWNAIREMVAQLASIQNRDWLLGTRREKLFRAILGHALDSGESALEEFAVDVAVQVERLRNSGNAASPDNVLAQYGRVVFDPEQAGLAKGTAQERLVACKNYDQQLKKAVGTRLDHRVRRKRSQGAEPAEAWYQARRELLDEWVEKAGPSGFMPMFQTIGGVVSIVGNKGMLEPQGRLVEYVRAMPSDTLMRNQIKAALGYQRIGEQPEDLRETDWKSMQRYLEQFGLDDAEIVRFYKECVWFWRVVGLRHDLPLHDAVVGALSREPRLAEIHMPLLCFSLPLVHEGNEYPVTEAMLENLRKSFAAKAEGPNARKGQLQALSMFYILERNAEALKYLDDYSLHERPEAFVLAFANGHEDWCGKHLPELVRSPELANLNISLDPDMAALKPFLDSIENGDLRLMLEVFFAVHIDDASKRGAVLEKLLRRFESRTFGDWLYAVRIRAILENAGVVEKHAPDPNLQKWVGQEGLAQLLERVESAAEPESALFGKYIDGLMDHEGVDAVLKVYDAFSGQVLEEGLVQRLVLAPIHRNWDVGHALYTGKPSDIPPCYGINDADDFYRLMSKCAELLQTHGAAPGNDLLSYTSFAACALTGNLERYPAMKYDKIWPDMVFPVMSLLSGVHNGEPDEEQMRKVIREYYRAVLFMKEKGDNVWMNGFSWENAARSVMSTHPYCNDPGKWGPLITELSPGEVDLSRYMD